MSLAKKLLCVLGESPLPVTTPSLVAIVATGLSHPRSRVWEALQRLERGGRVVRHPRGGFLSADQPGGPQRVTAWALSRGV